MSERSEPESPSRAREEADGDQAVADLKRSLERLRGQVGAYRERVGEGDDGDSQP